METIIEQALAEGVILDKERATYHGLLARIDPKQIVELMGGLP